MRIQYQKAAPGWDFSLSHSLGVHVGTLWQCDTLNPRGCWFAFKLQAGIWHAYRTGPHPTAWTKAAEGQTRDEAIRNAVRYAQSAAA